MVAFKNLGEAELTLFEAEEFVEPSSGNPETRAMPSPIFSTRPICSARGPSAAPTSFSRACWSQVSAQVFAQVLGSVVMREVGEDLCEIGTPRVVYNEMGAMQFQASIRAGSVLKTICGRAPNASPIRFR